MNILAIGAHPDDIEIGCGGLLLKARDAGHGVYMMVMTCGEMGGDADVRMREQERVAEFLGVKGVYWGGQEDTKLPVSSEVISLVDDAIRGSGADMVLFNYYEDTHQDHRALSQCVMSATRHVKRVLMFEVPSTLNFEPDIFVDICNVMGEKERLLRLHESQVDKTNVPHLMITENANACAVFRGVQCRVKYAEGFRAVRYLLDV